MANAGVQSVCNCNEHLSQYSDCDKEEEIFDPPEERNPMLNPVVLESFFQQCELEDLRRFRLVCKLWRDESLQRWRDEMVIYIVSDEYVRSHDNQNVHRQRLHWKDASILYISRRMKMKEKPYRKFRLINWPFPESKSNSDECTKKCFEMLVGFWDNVGPSMRELELREPEIESCKFFRKALVVTTPNLVRLKLSKMCPFKLGRIESLEEMMVQLSLEELSISLEAHHWEAMGYDDNRASLDPIPWYQLFVYFPNLRELEWKEFHDFACCDLIEAWDKLIEEEKYVGRKLNIKCYSVNRQKFGCSPELFHDFLEYPHFTIQTLQVELDNDVDEISPALVQHHRTLNTLEISSVDENPYNLFLTSQPFLTNLKLRLYVSSDFYFLKYTPNLTVLHLDAIKGKHMMKVTSLEKMGDIQLNKLTFLQLRPPGYMKADDCEPVIEMFVKWFPNVREVRCSLTNKSFRAICENWRGLRELEDIDTPGGLDDEGITGMVPGQKQEEEGLPNITDLKYLRKFATNSKNLSDDSVRSGFLKLEYLTGLRVTLSEKTSNEAFSTLFSRFRTGVCRSKSKLQDKEALNTELELSSQQLSKDFGICWSRNRS